MTLQQFQQRALTQFTREITDIFFSYIENDEDLLQDYQRVIGRDSNLDETNMSFGAAVKEWFHLENGYVSRDPKSKLIRSYTEHTRR
ncbi:hypothetical protein ACFLV6_00520 [Chloroflexota bacterium]